MSTPRIYVACLASYNAGTLHGAWIDAGDTDDMKESIAAMLRASKYPNVEVECPDCEGNHQARVCTKCDRGKVPSAEEYAIHDHEGFEGIKIGEHESLETIALHARMIEERDGAWAAYVGNVGAHYATEEGFSDSYRGTYSSPEDYAEEFISDVYDTKAMGNLANYIDYERFASDLELDGYSFIPGGSGVFVFCD